MATFLPFQCLSRRGFIVLLATEWLPAWLLASICRKTLVLPKTIRWNRPRVRNRKHCHVSSRYKKGILIQASLWIQHASFSTKCLELTKTGGKHHVYSYSHCCQLCEQGYAFRIERWVKACQLCCQLRQNIHGDSWECAGVPSALFRNVLRQKNDVNPKTECAWVQLFSLAKSSPLTSSCLSTLWTMKRCWNPETIEAPFESSWSQWSPGHATFVVCTRERKHMCRLEPS